MPHRLEVSRVNGSFGFSIIGQNPIEVVNIDVGGPAEAAGELC